MARSLMVLAVFLVAANELLAQEKAPTLKVGEMLAINMTGDVAMEYARRIGFPRQSKATDGLQIETTATIAQQLEDGRLRIEHSCPVRSEGKTTGLVTLTGTVDPAAITSDVTPKGTPVSAYPGGKSVASTEETKTLRLTLSSLKGLKLRTWTLTEEIGD